MSNTENCVLGNEIKRIGKMCFDSIGERNTEVDLLYAQLHLDCRRAWAKHQVTCRVCASHDGKSELLRVEVSA